MSAAGALGLGHTHSNSRQLAVEVLDPGQHARRDADNLVFQPAEVPVGIREGFEGRSQIVRIARHRVALNEQASAIDIGDHSLGRHRSGGDGHAFRTRFEREIASDKCTKEAEHHNGDTGKRDCIQLLTDRFVVQPALEPSRGLTLGGVGFDWIGKERLLGRLHRMVGGRGFVFGNHAVDHILERAHATWLSSFASSDDKPMGLPRCWAISSAGIALKYSQP